MKSSARLPSIAAFLCIFPLASNGFADDHAPDGPDDNQALTDPKELGRAAVRRGLAALARGDAHAALEEYQAAQTLVPEANMPYRYAADALVKLGRVDEAIENFEKYLAVKPDVSDASLIREKIESLRSQRQGRVELSCSDGSAAEAAPPPEVAIFVGIDGTSPTPARCPTQLRLTPGSHRLLIRATNMQDSTVNITVVPGATTYATVRLARLERPAPTAPPTAPRSPRRTLALTTISVGGVAVLGGLLSDLALLGPTIDEFDAAVERGAPDASSVKARIHTARIVTLSAYGAGAVLLATGGVLLLTTPKATVQTSYVPGGLGIVGTIAF